MSLSAVLKLLFAAELNAAQSLAQHVAQVAAESAFAESDVAAVESEVEPQCADLGWHLKLVSAY
jgi:hypothetical protein